MNTEVFSPYIVIRAHNPVRGDNLNMGIVLFTPDSALVAITRDKARLRAVHPDFCALPLQQWEDQLQQALSGYALKLTIEQQIALLPMLVQPFSCDTTAGMTVLDSADPSNTLYALMAWQVFM
jgi:hypothetical protein